jgi:hypothetical protein
LNNNSTYVIAIFAVYLAFNTVANLLNHPTDTGKNTTSKISSNELRANDGKKF